MPERDPDYLDEAVELATLLKIYQECEVAIDDEDTCKKCPVIKKLGIYNCPYEEADLIDAYFLQVIRKVVSEVVGSDEIKYSCPKCVSKKNLAANIRIEGKTKVVVTVVCAKCETEFDITGDVNDFMLKHT